MTDICRRALVVGRVQGVWYRGSTQEQARKLGVNGWAKNLPDGRVEVLMCGSDEAVHQLHKWLYQGPAAAKVDRVEVIGEEWQEYSDFTTG